MLAPELKQDVSCRRLALKRRISWRVQLDLRLSTDPDHLPPGKAGPGRRQVLLRLQFARLTSGPPADKSLPVRVPRILLAVAFVALFATSGTSAAADHSREIKRCATTVHFGVYPLMGVSCRTATNVAYHAITQKGTTPVSGFQTRYHQWGCSLTQGDLVCNTPAFAYPVSRVKQVFEALACGSDTTPRCPVVIRVKARAAFAPSLRHCGNLGDGQAGVADMTATGVSCARARQLFTDFIHHMLPKGWHARVVHDRELLSSGSKRVEGAFYG